MSTGLFIPVIRDGEKLEVEVEHCSKDEIAEYFQGIDEDQRAGWVFFLLGHAVECARQIEALERELLRDRKLK
jgi:hypothetical protein